MIAARQVYPQVNDQDVQQQFLEMLPTIRYVASFAFRRRPRLVREELMSEVVANCFVAFRRLVARGKANRAYASALAWYAVRQVRQGRRVGNRCQVRDVLSPDRKRKGFRVEPLGKLLPDGHWQELVVEDQHSTPADIAACRLDFRTWLRHLDRRRRLVALKLAAGETTKDAARHFGVSQARISQLRRELKDCWEAFQGAPSLAVA
jgi:hypothetical protein